MYGYLYNNDDQFIKLLETSVQQDVESIAFPIVIPINAYDPYHNPQQQDYSFTRDVEDSGVERIVIPTLAWDIEYNPISPFLFTWDDSSDLVIWPLPQNPPPPPPIYPTPASVTNMSRKQRYWAWKAAMFQTEGLELPAILQAVPTSWDVDNALQLKQLDWTYVFEDAVELPTLITLDPGVIGNWDDTDLVNVIQTQPWIFDYYDYDVIPASIVLIVPILLQFSTSLVMSVDSIMAFESMLVMNSSAQLDVSISSIVSIQGNSVQNVSCANTIVVQSVTVQ